MAERCWCGGESVASLMEPEVVICLESIYHDPISTTRKTEPKRLYVAGPMSNHPANNYPAFNGAASALRAHGYEVVNPAEFGSGGEGKSKYEDLLRQDLRALLDCEGVATLDGWWESVGARNEVQVAGLLKMPVRPVFEWEMRR